MRAVSGTRSGMLKLWRAEDGGATNLAIGDGGRIVALWFDAAGARVVTESRDRSLHLWDADRGVHVAELRGNPDHVRRMAISSDRMRAVSLSRDRTLRVWDLVSGRAQKALIAGDNGRALESFRSPNALLAELELVPQLDVSPAGISRESELALSADGRKAVLADQNQIIVWDIDSGEIGFEQVDDLDAVAVAISPDGRFAVVGSRFGALRVLDVAAARIVQRLEGHSERLLDLVISGEGRRLVSASRDNTIRIWDPLQGRQLGLISSRWAGVDGVSIAPDAGIAFSVHGDTIVASSLDTMAVEGSLSLDHLITALGVTPDGRRLAVGEDSGHVHFMNVEPAGEAVRS